MKNPEVKPRPLKSRTGSSSKDSKATAVENAAGLTEDLASLAAEARTYHAQATALLEATVDLIRRTACAAHRAGLALKELRRRIEKGAWTQTLENVIGIPHSTAYRYIKVADRYPTEQSLPAGKTLNEIYAILSAEQEESAPPESESGSNPAIDSESAAATPLARVSRGVSDLSATLKALPEDPLIVEPAEAKAVIDEIDQLLEVLKTIRERITAGTAAKSKKRRPAQSTAPGDDESCSHSASIHLPSAASEVPVAPPAPPVTPRSWPAEPGHAPAEALRQAWTPPPPPPPAQPTPPPPPPPVS